MPNIHAINAQGSEYGITAENGITQAQSAKIETIGSISDLTTTNKQTVVAAANEINGVAINNKTNIGNLSQLITSNKTTLVNAINSAQGELNNILNSYGRNVTAEIATGWVTWIESEVNKQPNNTLFSLLSVPISQGFLIGWKQEPGDVNAFFMYERTVGVAFRRNGSWTFYSILSA